MDELADYVASRAPIMYRLIGRDAIEETVRRAVVAWPCDEMVACERRPDRQRQILKRVKQEVTEGNRYGNPILILWGIGIIINLIWQWWLSRHKNQSTMREWQRAMEAGS